MTYESYIFLKAAQITLACFTVISFALIAKFFFKIYKWDKNIPYKSNFLHKNGKKKRKIAPSSESEVFMCSLN